MKNKKKAFHISVDTQIYEKLKAFCESEKMTLSEAVARAVEFYVRSTTFLDMQIKN